MDGDQNPAAPGPRTARDGVQRLLAERGDHLIRAAIALAGSRADGEDLLQAALERLLRRWSRVRTDPEGYLRRTLYNLAADGWRRRRAWQRRRPLLHADPDGGGTGTEAVDAVDLRDALGRALAQLPPMQRTVLVLRYWEQLSQAETAELLGCPDGTVKSTHAIKIVSSARLVRQLAFFAQISGTLWVDPATFLPVMVRWTWPHGTLAASFRWLTPTRANLAKLSVGVPGGFRPVRLPRGTGLSFSTVTYVSPATAATPTPTPHATPTPTPAATRTLATAAAPTPTAPSPTPRG